MSNEDSEDKLMPRDSDAPSVMRRRPRGGIVNRIFPRLDHRKIQEIQEKAKADEEARFELEDESLEVYTESGEVYKDKNAQPDNYKPPKTIEDLIDRARRGERYFCDAVIHGGTCDWKNFAQSNFSRAIIRGAVFYNTDFRGTEFTGANLRGCYFLGASNFSDCDFSEATLSYAEIAGSRSFNIYNEHVRFTRCNFEKADLRNTKGIELDDCHIAGARLPKNLSDPWTTLRTRYTGISAAVNLLLLIFFFLPYVVATMIWVSASQLEGLSEVRSYICAQGCTATSVYKLLIGYHNGWASTLPAVLLIIYNLMRAYLTIRVAPLREIEERCGHTPAYADYRHLHLVDRFVVLVGLFALLSFLNHLYLWLSMQVSVPTRLL